MRERESEEGNARGRGERRNERLRRTIQAEEEEEYGGPQAEERGGGGGEGGGEEERLTLGRSIGARGGSCERHACRKKCNVLLRRRDTGRGDARELRGHGNLDDLGTRLRDQLALRRQKKRGGKGERILLYCTEIY